MKMRFGISMVDESIKNLKTIFLVIYLNESYHFFIMIHVGINIDNFKMKQSKL